MGRSKNNQTIAGIEENVQILFSELKNKKSIKNFLNRKVKNVDNALSVGQKQRLGLLRALYDTPDILILDEFTSALDLKNEQIILNFVSKLKNLKAIIIVGHKNNSLKYCNRFFYLKDGNLYEK